jgi:5-methylcytosine-specific restriction endonuclease McrA
MVGMFHVDHKRPVSRGGRHEYANLQLAHKRCNLTASNKLK